MEASGPPSEIGRAMDTENWVDIFIKVGADPDGVHRRFLKRSAHKTAPLHGQSEITKPCDPDMPVERSLLRQFSTIARRQVRLILADRGYLSFLTLLPSSLACFRWRSAEKLGSASPIPSVTRRTSRVKSWSCSTSARSSWASH
jgi:hypothetical protein